MVVVINVKNLIKILIHCIAYIIIFKKCKQKCLHFSKNKFSFFLKICKNIYFLKLYKSLGIKISVCAISLYTEENNTSA